MSTGKARLQKKLTRSTALPLKPFSGVVTRAGVQVPAQVNVVIRGRLATDAVPYRECAFSCRACFTPDELRHAQCTVS